MNRTKKSLFVLETITFTKKRRRQKDDYQPFSTDVSFVSFHKRFEEAEASINRLLDEYNAWDFYIIRKSTRLRFQNEAFQI